MKISIIVPYHKEERYLIDCLESLEEQTFRDFEVIVVGDHCKADIPVVSYEIDSFEMTEGTGVASARNFGLERAVGDYVYFLDCDDYIEKDALELLYDMEQDICYGDYKKTWYKRQVYYENGQELDEQNQTSNQEIVRRGKNKWHDLVSAVDKMDTVSVHSVLFRREFLEEQKLTFNEDCQFLSDYPFIVHAFASTEKVAYKKGSMYIQRLHNDPINMPSLLQTKEVYSKLLENIYVFSKSFGYATNNGKRRLLRQLVFEMASSMSKKMLELEEGQKHMIFTGLSDAFQKVPKDVWNELMRKEKGYHKKLGKLVLQGKEIAFFRTISNRTKLRTLKGVLTSRAKMKKFLYRKLFTKMSMKEEVVLLESFFGKSYSDSPKYIFEYLNENYPGKYKYVWIMNEKKKLPYKAKQIKRFSFQYFYWMGRAKYIVLNSRQPVYFIKREGNVFLETWHGTPLKKLVFDMEEVTTASPLYKQQFYTQTRSWDYLVAPNEFSAEIFTHAFMYDGPMLKTGYPRNDILYRKDKETLAEEIKKKLKIPVDKRVILYAPTWRDDEFYGSGKYKFTLRLELDKMKEHFDKDTVILLRTHYFVADFLDVSQYGDFVKNVSKYDDIAELYLISDVLITDYSSVFFDYANLRRPMLFYTYDLEKYRDVLRGFYIDMEEELPGPLLSTTESVISALENIEEVEKKYKDKYKMFCDKFCDFENGTATKQIVEKVFGGKNA